LPEDAAHDIRESLRAIVVRNLERVLAFDPFKHFEDVETREAFASLLESDPAFAPFSLANAKYIAARLGGNLITSLHRKLGDLYQEIFLQLLRVHFQLPEENLTFSIEIEIDGNKQKRSTDGMIPHALLSEAERERLVTLLNFNRVGTAFEVRSCYQIGDSKRIQADRDMALALRAKDIEPVMLIFCKTSLRAPVVRLRNYWQLYEGQAAFDFVRALTIVDLQAFLQQERSTIQPIMQRIFDLI